MAKDNDRILLQWLSGELSDVQAEQRLSREDFLKYKQILQEVDGWVPDHNEEIFDPRDLLEEKHRTKIPRIDWWKMVPIAASVMLVVAIAVFFLYQPDLHQLATGPGETKEITLPDGGSKVILAAGSSLSWHDSDWKKDLRRVELSGKAYFTVEKGGTFIVHTTQGEVTVLGTRFEVFGFDQSLSVKCFDGRVRAVGNGSDELILSGGEASVFHQGRWEGKIKLEQSGPEWLQNASRFENAPLSQVIETLRREYEIKIDTSDINLDRRYTGAFPNDDLPRALKLIFDVLEIDYRLEDGVLFLSE